MVAAPCGKSWSQINGMPERMGGGKADQMAVAAMPGYMQVTTTLREPDALRMLCKAFVYSTLANFECRYDP